MDRDNTGTNQQQDHGGNENYGRGEASSREPGTSRSSALGVDLDHPPAAIESLPDTSKRFIAGMAREAFVQGLDACQKGTVGRDRSSQLNQADKWIGANVPFLEGVIGDVGSGRSSSR